MSTKFNLSVDLFTEDVRDAADVAQALRTVADRLSKFTSQPWSPYALSGKIYAVPDEIYAVSGSKRLIGTWSVDSEAEAGLTITAENDPDSRLHCMRCGQHVPDLRVCPACAHDHGEPTHEGSRP